MRSGPFSLGGCDTGRAMNGVNPRDLGLSLKPTLAFRVYSLPALLVGRPLTPSGT